MREDVLTIDGLILYADLMNMTNKETGEVSQMTKILYTVDVENTDRHVGTGILECYLQGDKLKVLEPFTKTVDVQGKKSRPLCRIELVSRLIKNGQKLYINKINNIEVK